MPKKQEAKPNIIKPTTIKIEKTDPVYTHKSVLVNEVLTYLHPEPNKVYVDATFGGGGHTRAILDAEPTCKVIGIDWDMEAIEENEPALTKKYGDRLTVLWGNFAHIYKLLKQAKIQKVDGILADFGTSQFQIHHKAGFSFQKNTPLDMRMSPAHQRKTATDIVNGYTEQNLAALFFAYGEEAQAKKIARAIVLARTEKRITTTGQLVDLIASVMPMHREKRNIHPATKVFQALRIEVNHELENISAFLKAAVPFLNPKGRLVCISFHSLEDRIVKNFFKEHSTHDNTGLEILTAKPVTASPDELLENPSSRSAKIRAALKK